MRALWLTLRMREGSVLHGGPPCSSFVFINAFTHGRKKDRPLGNTQTRHYVRMANQKPG